MFSRLQAHIFVAGGFGGMAPALFELAQDLRAAPPDVPGLAYVGSLLILAAIGGGVASAFKETNYLKALLLGLTLPALIASHQPSGDIPIGTVANGDRGISLLESFVSPALAQSDLAYQSQVCPVSDLQQENEISGSQDIEEIGRLEIAPRKECTKCWLWFYGDNGEFVARIPLENGGDGDGPYTFTIPERADKFGIWNEQINPYLWDLPVPGSDGSVSFAFNYNYSVLKDFMRGFGFHWKSYDPEVKPI